MPQIYEQNHAKLVKIHNSTVHILLQLCAKPNSCCIIWLRSCITTTLFGQNSVLWLWLQMPTKHVSYATCFMRCMDWYPHIYEGLAHFLHLTHSSWLVFFSHKLKPLTSFVGTHCCGHLWVNLQMHFKCPVLYWIWLWKLTVELYKTL